MRRTVLAALVAAGLLLTGCSDEDADPQADPSDTATSSDTATPDEPTASPEPTVEPASGVRVELDRIAMHAPAGWRKAKQLSPFLVQVDEPGSVNSVSLGDLSAVSDTPLQEQAEIAADNERQSEIVDPVEIGGVDWYHIVGREDRFADFEQFGTIHNGSEAVISFSLDTELAEDERQQIIDSVLATVEWK